MAAWALGQLGDPSGATFIAAQLASEQSTEVLATLAWAIGSIPPKAAPPRLLSLLTSEDRNTRLKAAWALSEIADPASLPALQAAIKQPQSRGTMRALLRAVVAIDQGSAELAELINSRDSMVRQVAVEALAGNRRVDPWPWPWPRVIVSP
jgi:HEAT repeat protein